MSDHEGCYSFNILFQAAEKPCTSSTWSEIRTLTQDSQAWCCDHDSTVLSLKLTCVNNMVNIAWDRLLTSFMLVDATVLKY